MQEQLIWGPYCNNEIFTYLDCKLIVEHVKKMELEYILAFEEVELDELAHFKRLLEVLGKRFPYFHLFSVCIKLYVSLLRLKDHRELHSLDHKKKE